MPRPRALRPDEVARTLVGRFEKKSGGPGLVDKMRQLHTKFGARSRRVFLVWVRWTGVDRGEGGVRVIREFELLPTPEVADGASRNPYSAGMLPMGSIRLNEVSAALSIDTLTGRLVPGAGPIEQPDDFFYEIQEDARSGQPGARARYRVAGEPLRRETDVCWTVPLQRASNDRSRDGKLPALPIPEEDE